MKTLIAFIILVLVSCEQQPSNNVQQSLFENNLPSLSSENIKQIDFYDNGMHYKMYYQYSYYGSTMALLNVTLDSLKFQEYQFTLRDSIATYGGGGASGIISLNQNNNK